MTQFFLPIRQNFAVLLHRFIARGAAPRGEQASIRAKHRRLKPDWSIFSHEDDVDKQIDSRNLNLADAIEADAKLVFGDHARLGFAHLRAVVSMLSRTWDCSRCA